MKGRIKMNNTKYKRGYFNPPQITMNWATKEYITKAPIWCSVDLRDGNQSLIVPMSLEEKLEFFKFLVKVGFKEIEIGFPAASDTEYEFVRKLIEEDLIPDDVTIQVLTQSREHIIRKTFESLKGVKRAVVHLYNSTSVAQREQVFRKTKEEIIDIAIFGAEMFLKCAEEYPGNYAFEYSPESFTGTEMDFALDICNAVIDVWKPTADNKVIINLPVTVSHSMPHVYANQVEYMCNNINNRENIIISLHPHNDRGCAVADSEMGLLAGADRIEGTLFGNGERTGNVDIITLALNMFSHGVDPELDFTDMPAIVKVYEEMTRMSVYDRQPYSGKLVFAAFSGSHQDAIAKGMKWREENECVHWTVPYLPIDPKDIGREYESDVIRINSQSGKGGIGYLLEQNYGYNMPAKMRESFGYFIKGISDREHRELKPDEIFNIFNEEYINRDDKYKAVKVKYDENGVMKASVTLKTENGEVLISGEGNGRLDSVFNALMMHLNLNYSIQTYTEHAVETGSKSDAVSYIGISDANQNTVWGVGKHNDIIMSSVYALMSAINRI